MLKQRILTAIPLIVVAVAILIFAPPMLLAVVTAALLLLAAWEWTTIIGIKKQELRAAYLVATALLMVASLPMASSVILISMVFWLAALYSVLVFPRYKKVWGQHKLFPIIIGFFVIVPCWHALNAVNAWDPFGLLFLLCIIWASDITAFFIGIRYGNKKLLPDVSPKKSWAGLYGALLGGLLIALFGVWWLVPATQWLGLIVLSLVTVLAAVLGDLFESLWKRIGHVKDSGSLLPGHGGILDRVDSMTAAAPVFAVGLLLF